MTYWTAYDMIWNSKIDKLFGSIVPQIENFLLKRSYGEEVDQLQNIILCNDALKYGFKKRCKFSRKDRYIYFDVYIDYDIFMLKNDEERKKNCGIIFKRYGFTFKV